MLPILGYIARSMVDGSPEADKVFDELANLAEAWLAEHHTGRLQDRRAYAALLVAMELGTLVMGEQLSRVTGSDVSGAEGRLRLRRVKLELYSNPIMSTEVARQADAALDCLRRRSTRP